MNGILTRTRQDKETPGVIDIIENDNIIETFASMELPWKDNEHDVSCIPVGEYDVEKCVTEEHGEHFRILNVPGRENVMIHEGNFVSNSRGCILVGQKSTDINGDGLEDISNSKKTLKKMYDLMPQTFKLKIQWG